MLRDLCDGGRYLHRQSMQDIEKSQGETDMAGLENITGSILQEAKDRAAVLVQKAQNDAEQILREAERDRNDILCRGRQKADRDADAYAASIDSQAEHRTREAILSEKQAIIREIIEKAREELATEDNDPYFKMMENLIRRNIRAQSGEILFGERDLNRLPAGFEDRLDRMAQEAGGTLRISPVPAEIENGFLLRYGGIDENCSLKSLFEEKRDLLQDTVHEILFRQET